jgi:hypothetical protein
MMRELRQGKVRRKEKKKERRDSQKNNPTCPTTQCHPLSRLTPQTTNPTPVKSIAGKANGNLISATRTPPFPFASRLTIASLNRPEQNTSLRIVPRNKPRKSNPWMSGVYVGYAAGIMVITDRTHQYHRKE